MASIQIYNTTQWHAIGVLHRSRMTPILPTCKLQEVVLLSEWSRHLPFTPTSTEHSASGTTFLIQYGSIFPMRYWELSTTQRIRLCFLLNSISTPLLDHLLAQKPTISSIPTMLMMTKDNAVKTPSLQVKVCVLKDARLESALMENL